MTLSCEFPHQRDLKPTLQSSLPGMSGRKQTISKTLLNSNRINNKKDNRQLLQT